MQMSKLVLLCSSDTRNKMAFVCLLWISSSPSPYHFIALRNLAYKLSLTRIQWIGQQEVDCHSWAKGLSCPHTHSKDLFLKFCFEGCLLGGRQLSNFWWLQSLVSWALDVLASSLIGICWTVWQLCNRGGGGIEFLPPWGLRLYLCSRWNPFCLRVKNEGGQSEWYLPWSYANMQSAK